MEQAGYVLSKFSTPDLYKIWSGQEGIPFLLVWEKGKETCINQVSNYLMKPFPSMTKFFIGRGQRHTSETNT